MGQGGGNGGNSSTGGPWPRRRVKLRRKNGQQVAQSPPANSNAAPQQAPATGNPAGQSGLGLDQVAGLAKTYGIAAVKTAAVAFVAGAAIAGFLTLAVAAAPAAAGVATAAVVILVMACVFELAMQAQEVYYGKDRCGADLSANDRAEIAGNMTGGLIGGYLGGRAGKFLGDAFLPQTAGATPGSQGFAGDRCFPAGTLVATEDGPKAIERIVAHEQVWAYDLKTQSWQLCRVIKPLDRYHPGDYVSVDLQTETIESTGGHPFWVVAGEDLSDRPEPDHVPHLGARGRDTRPVGRTRETSAPATCSCNARARSSRLKRFGPMSSACKFTISRWPISNRTPSD